ncbi:hypothetical protein M1N45_04200 [Dehalococcoidia bacterium]|nr:hypothetical protein [Dehalococcoidia bacterium]
MVNKSWTDQEILGVIQSKAPSHVKQTAWDVLIGKYQDELETEALKLWGYDDFLVSDTIDQALITARTWIQVHDDIDAVNGNFKQWLFSILDQQFSRDSGNTNNHRPLFKNDSYEEELSLLGNDGFSALEPHAGSDWDDWN